MADNITTQSSTLATIPSSTKISTDEDVTNGHVQRMKLAVSADGSSTHVGADADGLQVQGAAAENAAAAGNPVLAAGRYDATPRTLGDGDAGALALDTDGALQVSDGGNSLTIDNADITTLAGAVHNEDAAHGSGDAGVQVLAVRQDSGAALAGTDGDYSPLQVDSTGNLRVNVAAGSSSGTEYTEDDAAAANPAGPAQLLVRQDTPATLTSTDGDMVAQRATNYGAAYVQVVDSSGNLINSFGGSGGTSHADDAAFSIGSASSITPTGYLADETTPDSVDEGDVGVPRMTLSRKPYAVISDPTSENSAAVDGSGHLQVDIAADSVGIGGGTEYAVDAALGATPTGKLALGKRDDALSALTPAEGDAVELRVDANGALWVIPSGTVTVDGSGVTQPVSGTVTTTNAGTFAVQVDGDALTALQLIDNIVQAEDAVHGSGDAGVMSLAVRNDTLAALAGTDGDYAPLQVNASGALFIQEGSALDVSAATVTVDGSGVTQPVSGTVTANLSATDNAVLDTIETNTDYGTVTGGGTEAGALRVTLASDSTGVVTVDGTVTASDATGNVAHDAADSGNPLKVGFKAKNFDGSAPGAAVAEDDRVDSIADVYGRQYVETAHPNYFNANENHSTAQTNNELVAAPGAGLSLYITDITVSTDTAMSVKLVENTGTPVDKWGPHYFGANGGTSASFRTPIKLSANTNFGFTSSASGNHTVTVQGYTAA